MRLSVGRGVRVGMEGMERVETGESREEMKGPATAEGKRRGKRIRERRREGRKWKKMCFADPMSNCFLRRWSTMGWFDVYGHAINACRRASCTLLYLQQYSLRYQMAVTVCNQWSACFSLLGYYRTAGSFYTPIAEGGVVNTPPSFRW